jgi:hypothetical protein
MNEGENAFLLAIVGGIVGYLMWNTGVTNAQNAKS